ncbi:MAG TPA: PQ-loop repeat-containing protein [Methanosarcinales archaeon]|nr:PQ-loop repeat-containing protein [Methanosarcinales archaeon]
MIEYLAWLAVIILPLSYWIQVARIARHKEVRDLSLLSYCLMACGFALLSVQAYSEGSTIFLTKQLLVLLPALTTVILIIYHRKDEWHDDKDKLCSTCTNELEPHWDYCTDCGTKILKEDCNV